MWHTVVVSEGNSEKQTIPEYKRLLENVEKNSESNFVKVKDRLFDFYYDGIRQKLIEEGNLTQESTRAVIRQVFEPNPGDLKIDDLRIVKALRPNTITKLEHIPYWTPAEIKTELSLALSSNQQPDEFFAYTVSLGLVQLLRPEGLLSTSQPGVNLFGMGLEGRQRFEKAISEIGLTKLYPHYAVVEKQEGDENYVQTVSNYGTAPDKSIQMVLSMKGKVGERASYTVGDSTSFLTNAEIDTINLRAKSHPWQQLENMLINGDLSRKTELEEIISNQLFPNHDYTIEARLYGFEWWPYMSPTDQTIRENLLDKTVLLPAFELIRKLKSWQLLHPKNDYLEAQIYDQLGPEDCEGILIHESVRPHLMKILNLLPEIMARYDKYLERGIIRYHNTYLKS